MSYKKTCTGVMYAYEANTTVTINASNEYHAVSGVFSEGSSNEGFTFLSGSVGTITNTANNGGILRCTSISHGLVTGQYITLNGMGDPAHVGITKVTIIDVDTFDCDNINYNSISDTGNWQRGDSLTCNAECGGVYDGSFSITARSSVSNKNFKFEVYVNNIAYDEFAWERLFGNTGFGVGASGGVGIFKSNDTIWIATKNTTDSQNVIIEHGNLHFSS